MDVSDTIQIPLWLHGEIVAYATLDACDAEQAKHRWRWGQPNGYAVRNIHTGSGSRVLRLHREIMGLTHGDGFEVDHKNRDRLDYRRGNLRVVTRAQNNQNVGSYPNTTSRFRGVYWHKQRGKWYARATIGGVHHSLGLHDREEDAGAAAAAFRAEHMPYSEEAA